MDKTCHICEATKPTEEFYSIRGTSRFQSGCKACRSAMYKKKYADLSPKQKAAKARQQNLTRRFRMSEDTYDELLASQEGTCAICDRPERVRANNGEVRRLAVDHCHASGNIRGLLCQSCNVALGKLEDSPNLLRKAADYLERSNNGYLGPSSC